jgi:hypothetical protein
LRLSKTECHRVSSHLFTLFHLLIINIDLIHDERNSPNPYKASNDEARCGKILEDYVKLWLVDYINDQVVAGATPTDNRLLIEAQRVVQKTDTEDTSPKGPDISWFRDLIMLSTPSRNTTSESDNDAGFGRTANMTWATQIENTSSPKPTGRDLSLTGCEKEKALMDYVESRRALGLTPVDSDLQAQACKIIEDVEPTSNFKCKGAVQWFKFLINSSTNWLSEFRHRAGLPRSSQIMHDYFQSTEDKTSDYSVYNPYRIQGGLKDWIQLQQAVRKTPPDDQIQRKAGLTIFASDDTWNQTILDDMSKLNAFMRQNDLQSSSDSTLPMLPTTGKSPLSQQSNQEKTSAFDSPRALHWDLDEFFGLESLGTNDHPSTTPLETPLYIAPQSQPSCNTKPLQPLRYFLSDANCYGRLEKELTRFVMSCVSPNNPLQHVCPQHLLPLFPFRLWLKMKNRSLLPADPF